MAEDRTEGAQQGEAEKRYVTVGEAAKLLGVHRNTVHHRIKIGRITAHKVVEGEREVYRVELDSLGVGRTSADVHTLDAQRTTAGEELARMIATRLDEIVRNHTEQLGNVREELGAERARRQMAEERVEALEGELRALQEARESPEGPAPTDDTTQAPEGPQTGAQAPERRSWWSRVFGG
jgi:excisionase family DNA binding protein